MIKDRKAIQTLFWLNAITYQKATQNVDCQGLLVHLPRVSSLHQP